jgi:hypothetical protein
MWKKKGSSGAFQEDIVLKNAFQTESERILWDTAALAVGGILYTAIITIVGVIVAMTVPHDFRFLGAGIYGFAAVVLFGWGVSDQGKRSVKRFVNIWVGRVVP